MSADFGLRIGLSLLASLAATGAAAQEANLDLDFLEYLGTWDATDEDWMVVSELSPDLPNNVSEPDTPVAAADEDNTESSDEH